MHKRGWGTDTNPSHVDPHLIPLTKETLTGKSDEDYVKLKLLRYPTSITSDLYEFRMSLFDHGNPEEFLLFFRKLIMIIASTGMLETYTKVQYLCTPVSEEDFRKFELLYADVENTDTSLTVDYLLKGLAWYPPL